MKLRIRTILTVGLSLALGALAAGQDSKASAPPAQPPKNSAPQPKPQPKPPTPAPPKTAPTSPGSTKGGTPPPGTTTKPPPGSTKGGTPPSSTPTKPPPGSTKGGTPPAGTTTKPAPGSTKGGTPPTDTSKRGTPPTSDISKRTGSSPSGIEKGRPEIGHKRDGIDADRWHHDHRFHDGHRWWDTREHWGHAWHGHRPAWHWGRPWHTWHHNWHHGYWDFWTAPPAFWFGGNEPVVFNNTYYAPTNIFQPFDYSNPLPPPTREQAAAAFPPDPPKNKDGTPDLTPTDAPPEPKTKDIGITEAIRKFNVAREAFKTGDYAKAEEQADTAIRKLPSDATLHEFRGLALFAQGKYKEAAAGLYAVLAAGPGWDRQTMMKLYPDATTYTEQLESLKAFIAKEPDAGYGHFVLAYHYLALGSKDAAVKELKEVVRTQPDDKLSAAVLKALTEPA